MRLPGPAQDPQGIIGPGAAHGAGVWRRECQLPQNKRVGEKPSQNPHSRPGALTEEGTPHTHLCIDSSCPCCCRTAAAVDTWGLPTTAFRASRKSSLSLPCREETLGATGLPLGQVGVRGWSGRGAASISGLLCLPPPPDTASKAQALPVGPPEADPLCRYAPFQTEPQAVFYFRKTATGRKERDSLYRKGRQQGSIT